MRTRPLAAPLALTVALSTLAAPSPSPAFCGFYVSGSSEGLYNKATRAALMRSGARTVLTMSNDYDGPPEDLVMVVPVPGGTTSLGPRECSSSCRRSSRSGVLRRAPRAPP